MNTITSLQHLVNSIGSVQEKIEASRLTVMYESKSNNIKSSEYHLKFNGLMNKFSEFAKSYKCELDQFHKLLLNNITKITLKAQQDKLNAQQAAINAKLDAINNNNNEICTNLNAFENCNSSAAPSVKDASYSTHPPSPTPVQSKPKPKPKSTPKPKPKHNKKHISARKNAKTHKPIYRKKVKTPEYRAVSQSELESKNNDNNSVNGSVKSDYKPWVYRGQARSSTRIFIGNIPEISRKTLAVHIARKARIDVNEISETIIRMGGKGPYAVVRFSNQIDIHTIRNFMNKVNKENSDLFEKMKKDAKNGKNKSNGNISWKKKIYLRFHRNFNYNEQNINNTLYVRNFDILDENCYDQLTKKLIENGGALMTEIKISLDRHRDPYCVVTFQDTGDAEYCCTSEIEFNGRILEMRYYR